MHPKSMSFFDACGNCPTATEWSTSCSTFSRRVSASTGLMLFRPAAGRVRGGALALAQTADGAGGDDRAAFLPRGIELREAEAHFVDEEENLEEGEKLLRAIKAFDERGVMLCAGALVRSTHDENYETDGWDRALQLLSDTSSGESEVRYFHDLWLGDSIESGVGPNIQMKGALSVLDCLFLHHLRHASASEKFRVHADGDLASASRSAARSRGFKFEVQQDTGEDILVWDSWHLGPEAYTRAAVADAASSQQLLLPVKPILDDNTSSSASSSSFALSILGEITRRLPRLALPPACGEAEEDQARGQDTPSGAPGRNFVPGWVGAEVVDGGLGWDGGFLGWAKGRGAIQQWTATYGEWQGGVVTGLLGDMQDGDADAVLARDAHAQRLMRGEQGVTAARKRSSWSMETAVQERRERLRRFHVARRLVDEPLAVQVLAKCQDIDFNSEADSVDGAAAHYGSLVSQGRPATGAAEQAVMSLIAPVLEERILPLVRDAYCDASLQLCEAFVRKYGGEEGVRVSIPAHLDSLSLATAVVGLCGPDDHDGGIYMQAGAHAASRRLVELERGDLLLHGFDMLHGVEVPRGQRYSLVLWFSDGKHACAGRGTPWLQSAAARGDDVAQYSLAGLLEKEHVDEDGSGEQAGRVPRQAVALYLAAAQQGNPWALARLGLGALVPPCPSMHLGLSPARQDTLACR